MLFGYDQNMDWSLRVDVIECNDLLILKNEFSRDCSVDDFAK
jgi:hypothetical protein